MVVATTRPSRVPSHNELCFKCGDPFSSVVREGVTPPSDSRTIAGESCARDASILVIVPAVLLERDGLVRTATRARPFGAAVIPLDYVATRSLSHDGTQPFVRAGSAGRALSHPH